MKLYVHIYFTGYITDLWHDLILRRELNNSFAKARDTQEDIERPSPLSKSFVHDKSDIVDRHRSRFNWN